MAEKMTREAEKPSCAMKRILGGMSFILSKSIKIESDIYVRLILSAMDITRIKKLRRLSELLKIDSELDHFTRELIICEIADYKGVSIPRNTILYHNRNNKEAIDDAYECCRIPICTTLDEELKEKLIRYRTCNSSCGVLSAVHIGCLKRDLDEGIVACPYCGELPISIDTYTLETQEWNVEDIHVSIRAQLFVKLLIKYLNANDMTEVINLFDKHYIRIFDKERVESGSHRLVVVPDVYYKGNWCINSIPGYLQDMLVKYVCDKTPPVALIEALKRCGKLGKYTFGYMSGVICIHEELMKIHAINKLPDVDFV